MVEEIARFGAIRRPHEACGIILGDRVIELRNASDQDRTCHYSLGAAGDIVNQLRVVKANLDLFVSKQFMVWHTHPGGLIGPSPGDMEHRIEGIEYLVVAFTEDGPVPARF